MPRAEVLQAATGTATDRTIRYAVLCSPQDRSGPWVRDALQRRGLPGVRLVTAEELVYSTRLVHRIAPGGAVSTEVDLVDGTVFGPGLRAVLNRLVDVPTGHLARTEEQERVYAIQETYATLTSILAGLPALNRATARGLPGPWLRPAEWLCEAGRAGLTGVGFRSGQPSEERAPANQSLVVVGDRVVPTSGAPVVVPDHVQSGSLALARRVDVQVLGLEFLVRQATWLFVSANPTPDLRWGGKPLADAVVDLMLAGEATP